MTRAKATRTLIFAGAIALATAFLVPTLAVAEHHEESDVAAEIKAMIEKDNQYIRKNLEDPTGTTSKHGSLEFWSSGGLLQTTDADAAGSQYESFSITAKHIQVIELPGGEAAVAMYYAEGSMQPKGRAPVSHYMTRVMQLFVKEDGKWKARAGHWSPIAAGGGTSQAAIE